MHLPTVLRSVAISVLRALLALWVVCWFVYPVPLLLKAIVAGLLAIAAVSPASGLLIFAGLAPFTTVLAGLSGSDIIAAPGTALLERMALAVCTGICCRSGFAPTRLGPSGLVLAVVAVASAASVLPTALAVVAPGAAAAAAIAFADFARGTYGPVGLLWTAVRTSLVVVECALLAWCVERMVRRRPELALQLLTVALMAHAGASLLSFYRVLQGLIGTGDWLRDFPARLLRGRTNLQMDRNAAASALILPLISAVGMMRAEPRRQIVIVALACIVLVGLWITGSRAALASALIALIAGAVWRAVRVGGRTRRRAGLAVAALVVTGIAGVAFYPRGRNPTVSDSVTSRFELLKGGLRMFASAPAFGVGIGRFYEKSPAFIDPGLSKIVGDDRENAHNNFVQVLAEQGLAGLLALLAAIGLTLVPALRSERLDSSLPRFWLMMAIVGCLGSWLTGHPLLVPEFALVFWFYLGILAGLTTAPGSMPFRPAFLAGAVIIALTVPARAIAIRDAADFEHQGIGVSALWQFDGEQRYRDAGMTFSLFLPTGEFVHLPVHRAPGAPDPVTLEMRLDGRLFNAVIVGGDAWVDVPISLDRSARRFARIDFFTRVDVTRDETRPLLRVGRDRGQ